MQSCVLTEVRDCDLLIVVTSSTFLKRKDMLKAKSSLNCFLGESGSPAALQLLLSFAWPVRCKVALYVYQVVQDSMKSHYLLHLFAAAIADTIRHNSNDHCHCHCIQLDNELKSLCFPFFSSKTS